MIKFRAWDKTDKKMISWEQMRSEFTFEYFEDENLVFMQSTGLFDDTGQEIFEGDVVKIRDSNEIGIVKRDPHEPRLFVDYNKGSKCKLWFMEPVTESFFTVIGNIHENPDLVEDI